MSMFIVGKVWLFAVIAGLILLFPKQSRFLAGHLLLGANFGLLMAFVGLGILRLLFRSETSLDPLVLVAGGILGILAGSRIALKLKCFSRMASPREQSAE